MEDLERTIERAKSLLELATRLLRFCRARTREYRRNRPLDRSRIEARVRVDAEPLFHTVSGERLTASFRTDLAAFARGWRREVSEVVIARGVLLALDIRCGHRLISAYRRRPARKLEPGDPVPVARPPWKQIIKSSLTTDPGKRDDSIDRISTLCLFPTGSAEIEVHLSPQFSADGLPPIGSEHRGLATAVPNRTLEELEPPLTVAVASRDGFFPVRPRSVKRQLDRVLFLIERAAVAGASILVLPELCLTPSMEPELLRAFERAPRSLRLLVAGSFHVDREGKKRNESLTFLRGRTEPLRHHKFSNYFVTESGGEIYEGIHVDPLKVTLYLTDEGWTFTVLICKDLLSDAARDVLRALRVPLVLVPALTPKTDIFETYVEELAISNQGIVLLANNAISAPNVPDRRLALIATPRAGGLNVVHEEEVGPGGPAPGYFLHHLDEKEVRWRRD